MQIIRIPLHFGHITFMALQIGLVEDSTMQYDDFYESINEAATIQLNAMGIENIYIHLSNKIHISTDDKEYNETHRFIDQDETDYRLVIELSEILHYQEEIEEM